MTTIHRVISVCSIVCVIVACACIIGCVSKKSNNEQPATSTPWHYTVIAVTNGGTITGTVKINGNIPVVPDLAITHDNNHCGTAKPSPRLLCGANGGVSNAYVYLQDISTGKTFAVPIQPLFISQKDCMYQPHTVAVPVGAGVNIRNDDHILHNIHIYSGDESVWNQAQPISGQTNVFTPRQPGILRMQCDAGHIWMSGYIFVAGNPYYALTDSSGTFTITDVPPGTYTISCWHEGWNATKNLNHSGALLSYSYDAPYEMRQNVTIHSNDTVHIDFAITPH